MIDDMEKYRWWHNIAWGAVFIAVCVLFVIIAIIYFIATYAGRLWG